MQQLHPTPFRYSYAPTANQSPHHELEDYFSSLMPPMIGNGLASPLAAFIIPMIARIKMSRLPSGRIMNPDFPLADLAGNDLMWSNGNH